ncbi:MAG: hypothetical protein K0R02_9 [Rickettsiaceae bacterium]|nr:hypothetical protein [Rickettsiaceae bacterium]
MGRSHSKPKKNYNPKNKDKLTPLKVGPYVVSKFEDGEWKTAYTYDKHKVIQYNLYNDLDENYVIHGRFIGGMLVEHSE